MTIKKGKHQISDRRSKNSIADLPNCLTKINSLRPVQYKFNDDDLVQANFIAQEFYTVFPEYTMNTDDGVTNPNPRQPWAIDIEGITPYIVGSIKDLNRNITTVQTNAITETISVEGALGTLTWTGTTAPSGTITKRYQWIKQGHLVNLIWQIRASVAGVLVSAVSTPLPGDCPTPTNLSNQTNDSWVSLGTGAVLSGINVSLSNSACGLYKTAGATYDLRVYSGATLAANFASGMLTYMTT